ncbi:hypothetical protein GCM10010402_66460 [Actinomadura luteofluorescens]|uniref:hypothetical protein n=1 Tax=Actinomadura luteofluorescens TaxID=46163 RepID=UPI002164CD25|nr:hypothetical protein [Actinomadura glauciflava]MCR3744182.1 hypothetical protein [Actinomadura glauciflava]
MHTMYALGAVFAALLALTVPLASRRPVVAVPAAVAVDVGLVALAVAAWTSGYAPAVPLIGIAACAVPCIAWRTAKDGRTVRRRHMVTGVTAPVPGLIGRTVGVETFAGRPAAVERHDGTFVAVLAVPVAGAALSASDLAASYAQMTHARLVGRCPASPVVVRSEIAVEDVAVEIGGSR